MARKHFSRTERLPSKEILSTLLKYDPETGKLFWLARSGSERVEYMWNVAHAGKEAFTYKSPDGYLHGRICDIGARAHRVIWKMVHGDEPAEIDHINGKRDDNTLSNLRRVTATENRRNSCVRHDNVTGTPGVYWEENHNKWRARIRVNGKQLHLGRFDEKAKAIEARKKAERDYGFHQNHGRPK